MPARLRPCTPRAPLVLAVLLSLTAVGVRAVSEDRPSGGASVGAAVRPAPVDQAQQNPRSGFDLVRDRYLTVLGQVAGRDGDGTVAMAELQREVYQGDSLAGIARLHRYQLSTVAAMAAGDPQVYQPVVWLHYRTAGSLVTREDQALRFPSFMLAADLAGSMRRSVRTPEQQCFATGVMLCTAYTFLEEGQRQDASEVFARVVRFDPGNAPALLGSAAIHERHGRYDDAVRELQQLVGAVPDSDEGRLRLAVNLARTRHRDEAEAELRQLLEGCEVDWIRSVGYQELARRMMHRGQPQAAEELLRQAVADQPGNHSLKIQLALVLDLTNRTTEAAKLLESIQADGSSGGVSPRWRYAVWPSFDRRARERELEEQAAAAAPALARALAGRGEMVS